MKHSVLILKIPTREVESTKNKEIVTWCFSTPGFYFVKKPKRFVILSSDKSSERNLSCFFWHKKTQEDRAFTERRTLLLRSYFKYLKCSLRLSKYNKRPFDFPHAVRCSTYNVHACALLCTNVNCFANGLQKRQILVKYIWIALC